MLFTSFYLIPHERNRNLKPDEHKNYNSSEEIQQVNKTLIPISARQRLPNIYSRQYNYCNCPSLLAIQTRRETPNLLESELDYFSFPCEQSGCSICSKIQFSSHEASQSKRNNNCAKSALLFSEISSEIANRLNKSSFIKYIRTEFPDSSEPIFRSYSPVIIHSHCPFEASCSQQKQLWNTSS